MALTALLACPLVGMLLILALPKTAVKAIRSVALLATGAALLGSLQLLAFFQPGRTQVQFQEKLSWIPQLNIFYTVGVDGISLPMVLLTALLSFLACIASTSITERQKEYYALYLLLEVGMLGTFLALDLFLFYVFWEVVLVPMYLMIGIWGGGRREYSAFKFFVYTLAGSLAMLLAILALYLRTRSFDMVHLAAMGHTLDLGFQQLLFVAFFLGFAIKVPVFPFHTWLPDAHVDAPTPGSVLLAGVLLKMGGYGFFRIAYPIFPEGAQWFGGTMALLGMINIVYGAFVAMAQTDFKRLVAYSSVSHMGFVLLGLAGLTAEGWNGAMFQMFSHGVITGAMFLLVGVLYDRAHTRNLEEFGGLGVRVPVYAAFLIFFSLASLGLPGLSGFVAEFLALIGAYGRWTWQTTVSVLGVVVAAAYMLKVIRQVLLGPLNTRWAALPDMTGREVISLAPLLLVVLALGVYPLLLLQIQDTALQQVIAHVLGQPWQR
ncbi:MAG: NADH-quinone oxidoreductase subunit M [Candidatus Omnitrophica bacterium]|nr:NADH-quinone oxidoreductase subunit M [Candidatus Omnitrophota bacterium]